MPRCAVPGRAIMIAPLANYDGHDEGHDEGEMMKIIDDADDHPFYSGQLELQLQLNQLFNNYN